MPDKERYYIGPGLAERLKDTITRVGGMADGRASDEVPTRLQTMQRPSSSTAFRIGTYEGSWDKGSYKTVTFKNVTASPNTVTVVNLFASIVGSTATSHCAIAKEGSSWYLIAAEC